ncbi:hypothetical protein [Bifidobacterium oedipodis]|uniref:Uncharacterized protein n=1 Tax=Bifidobacterium oedipodis TaxID=2675322 RepID=A0A7Y0HT89_9BIFI|nr:hypothetical protein [Bifidobacterium sp. DSM 109957]NMM93872.1 hypothetical protein [Bifidobacterium sp. DSM 109957]
MGYVRLKRDYRLQILHRFGAPAARMTAERIAARAKALADARAVSKSVAGDISISVHAHGLHYAVVLNVIGTQTVGRQRHDQIASHLEFGYWNVWADRWIPGKHIIRDAARGF